ncbi:MAG: RraA family protein [Fusobacterium perfoetens]|uniref:RraA family protein n=1 Tax=Fusobacterium perfoetens TaxID=852 RepID=UPI0023F27780|nr:RraA family protein [Fusobacterium perfoetens]MCI6151765.1 RraA family protein [Fusobacterium perfoetens]MDY3236874.1 RraA family protein [Fusobacterium perfoetens]
MMNLNEKEFLEMIKTKLNTSVIGDILDSYGYYHQILPPQIKAMKKGQKIVGYAMPVLMIDVFGPQEKPFGRLTEALDQIEENEIYICTGGTQRCAYWGELLTTTAKYRGGVGAIINGYHRDTRQIEKIDWPVFSMGSYAQDSGVRTQVINFRCTIEIGGVTIHNRDLIVADEDGVVVVPKEVEEKVIEEALEKIKGENKFVEAIKNGMSSTEAFKKFGVL